MGIKHRAGRRFWAGLLAAGVVCAFGVAVAQEQPGAPAPPELATQRDVNLSPDQMLTQARSYMPGMEQGAGAVRKQLSEARQARDVVKVLCLNDKLNQIDVAIRAARERLPNLELAAGRKDTDQARHEFTVIQVLRDRVRSLVAEANQCIGEETGFIGDTQITVDIDPTIPDDPSNFPDDPLISQPPTVSSPTQ